MALHCITPEYKPLFTACLETYLQHMTFVGNRPKTIKQYGAFLARFVSEMGDPLAATIHVLRRFLMSEQNSRSNSAKTIATKIAILRSFYQWLYREEYIERDPSVRLDYPKSQRPAPKFMTPDEIEALREACISLRDKLILELLYSSGMRVSELVAVDWTHIDWDAKLVSIPDGKGGKDRRVPISTKACRHLRQYRETRADNQPWVLMSREHGRLCKESIERCVSHMGVRAGINRPVTPHMLRHSLATHLLQSGVPLHIIQQILGHSTVATTQIYAQTQFGSVEQFYRRVIA